MTGNRWQPVGRDGSKRKKWETRPVFHGLSSEQSFHSRRKPGKNGRIFPLFAADSVKFDRRALPFFRLRRGRGLDERSHPADGQDQADAVGRRIDAGFFLDRRRDSFGILLAGNRQDDFLFAFRGNAQQRFPAMPVPTALMITAPSAPNSCAISTALLPKPMLTMMNNAFILKMTS